MAKISELKKTGLKGSLWNFLTSITGQIRNFIVSLVLARLLMPSDFGLISMALVFNGVLDTVLDFGFSNAVVQKKEVSQEQKSTIFYINLMIGGFFTVVLFLCAPLMAEFFKMPQLDEIVKFTSFSFILGSFGTLQMSLFQKELDFKSPFRARFSSSIISGIVGIVMALCGCGVWSLVVSNLCAWGLNSCFLWIQSAWRPTKNFNLESIVSMWHYGWKLTLTTVLNRVFKQIDTFIIGRVYSSVSLGFFNRAQSLNSLVVDYSFSSIRGVLLPTFSKLQDDKEKMRYSVISLLNTICFLNYLFSGLMYVCANDLIILLYGEKWIGSITLFKILSFFSITLSLPVLYDALMSSMGKMNMYLGVGIIRKPPLLLAIPIGLYYGLDSYIWAINILDFIGLIPYLWAARKCIDLSFYSQILLISKYLLLFVAIVILYEFFYITIPNTFVDLFIIGMIYMVIYFLGCYVFKFEGYRICLNLFMQIIKSKRIN